MNKNKKLICIVLYKHIIDYIILSIMSQRENIFRKSMHYDNYINTSSIQEEYLDNDWGWFVDIEKPINYTKSRKHISIQPTISEVFRIEDSREKINESCSFITQAFCVIIVALILL